MCDFVPYNTNAIIPQKVMVVSKAKRAEAAKKACKNFESFFWICSYFKAFNGIILQQHHVRERQQQLEGRMQVKLHLKRKAAKRKAAPKRKTFLQQNEKSAPK